MTYDDLIFGFQSKAISLGYFKQFIYGYEDRLNSAMSKDVNEKPNEYPILLIPPQNNENTRAKEMKFNPFSISGHKRPKEQKGVSIVISSNVCQFNTDIFVSGDHVVFKDSRTNYEIPVKITSVTGGLAVATSYITLTNGTITSDIEENHAAVHAVLEKNMSALIEAVRGGFTGSGGITLKVQSMGERFLRVIRLDQYGSRGYVRVIMEFNCDIVNCEL